jgi:hypothetical protein
MKFIILCFLLSAIMRCDASVPQKERTSLEGIVKDYGSKYEIDPGKITVKDLKTGHTMTKTFLLNIEKIKNEKRKDCSLVAKKSNAFAREINNLTSLSDLISQKFCNKNGPMPAIKIAKYKGFLEGEGLIFFKKANGKPVADLTLTEEVAEKLGNNIANMHKTFGKLEVEGEDSSHFGRYYVYKSLVHGDLHLGNIFYDESTDVFTLIDYETMKENEPIGEDVDKIMGAILAGNSCDIGKKFIEGYEKVFAQDDINTRHVVQLNSKRALRIKNCVPYPEYADAMNSIKIKKGEVVQ